MRYLLAIAIGLVMVACGGAAHATHHDIKASTTPGLYKMNQTIAAPSGVTLKVTSLIFDPAGDYFPLQGGGQWASVQMTMHNGSKQTYASGSLMDQSMALDFQVQSSNGPIGPSSSQHDPPLTGPILAGETVTGWMSFAVPNAENLRLVWVPTGAVIQLT